jgi:hypothetical protein
MKNKISTAPSPMMDNDYQAENDARTLGTAQDIMADKKRHGAAKQHASKQAAKFQAIAGVTGKAAEDKQLVKHVKGKMKKGY